jgi:hypothetical protein
MPMLTAYERYVLTNATPGNAYCNFGQRLEDSSTVQCAGRPGTGHLRLTATPLAGDTVTVIAVLAEVDAQVMRGDGATFVFTSTPLAVAPPQVGVLLGPDAATSAGNLAQVMTGRLSAVLTAARHAQDTTVVDIAHLTPGGQLVLQATAPTRLVIQNNGEQLPKDHYHLYILRRTVTAEDVARGRIRINTGLSQLLNAFASLYTDAQDQLPNPYNGVYTFTGGVLEFGQGSGNGQFVLGNVIELTAFGLR